MTKREYGCIPDLREKKDKKFQMMDNIPLPPSVDLRSLCPAIEDQGPLGSCTSFAGGGAIRVERKKQVLPDFVTSHLFLYYNSRDKRTKQADAGASIKNTIKAIATYGDCPESDWGYDINRFAEKPPLAAYKSGLKNRALSYFRVGQSLSQLKNCLAQGYPVVVGFTVYESFESSEVAATGLVPMPAPEESALGGHAVLLVGYSDTDHSFLLRNSWGTSWGISGYFKMHQDYLLDPELSSDFWTIRLMSA